MCSSMAESEPESIYTKHQKLVQEQQNHERPSKFYNHFLYKIALVVVFFVILPLFPSQAPEFFNQSVVTRSWELLHLLLVGIAVSYGLFSKRNEKTDEDNSNNNHTKFDNAHSYVSRFLQVSSVFDDETEPAPGSDGNKVQTWSSQYYRNEPAVIVAQEHSAVDEQRGTASPIVEKPLLLPVRSLKQRVPENPDSIESVKESSGDSGSLSRSNSRSGSRRFSSKSNKARGGEFGGLDYLELEEKLKESVVLPSPIPWRSRSGRLDVKEEVDNSTPMEESEFSRQEAWGSRSQGSRSSRSNSISSSPKLSPSPSISSPKKSSPLTSLSSSESQTKNAEDLGRKKSLYKSSPPPPPPPPPMFYKSSSMRPIRDGVSYEKDMRRSFSSETNNVNRSNGEFVMGRENSGTETKRRSYVDGSSMGGPVRTTRAGESVAGPWKVMEKSSKEVETSLVEKAARKRVGYDETSFRAEKMGHESIHRKPNSASFDEFSEEEKEDFHDKVVMESDEETESEDESFEESLIRKDIGETPKPTPNSYVSVSGSVSDEGPDVDKKADEFIAKFREQIRLQRIDSIKRSSAQISRNLSR
ncbi:hypothetical protein ACFX19_032627 [Malus domestica]